MFPEKHLKVNRSVARSKELKVRQFRSFVSGQSPEWDALRWWWWQNLFLSVSLFVASPEACHCVLLAYLLFLHPRITPLSTMFYFLTKDSQVVWDVCLIFFHFVRSRFCHRKRSSTRDKEELERRKRLSLCPNIFLFISNNLWQFASFSEVLLPASSSSFTGEEK